PITSAAARRPAHQVTDAGTSALRRYRYTPSVVAAQSWPWNTTTWAGERLATSPPSCVQVCPPSALAETPSVVPAAYSRPAKGSTPCRARCACPLWRWVVPGVPSVCHPLPVSRRTSPVVDEAYRARPSGLAVRLTTEACADLRTQEPDCAIHSKTPAASLANSRFPRYTIDETVPESMRPFTSLVQVWP